ncbi:unnamed protein product, partial [Allacma fusca]
PNSPPNSTPGTNTREAFAAELSRVTALWNLYGVSAGLPDPKLPPQQEALNLEVPTRNSEGAHTPKQAEKENGKRHDHHHSNSSAPPPPKRMALEEPETPVSRGQMTTPT